MTEPPSAAATGWRGRLARWQQVIRYYQAGVVNLAFGYGLYAALLALGLSAYPAQAIGHVLGMAFNYVTYSRHVFQEAGPAKLRFAMSYGINYLLSLTTLAVLKLLIRNDYISGAIVAVIVSVINFFVLKNIVFRKN